MSGWGGGSCFGFEVESPLSFKYLRGGRGGERMTVLGGAQQGARAGDTPVLQWRPRPGRRWSADLYRRESGFALCVHEAGWFEVDPEQAAIRVPDGPETAVRREERLWGIPALLCFLQRGELPLHAAALEIDGRAVLLAGPGRAGKTTLAAALVSAGHRLLSEDLCCLRRSGDAWGVVPGPAMLRPRHDVAAGLRLPDAELVAEDADRVHLALARRERGSCEPVPLAAILLLRDSDGDIELARVPASRALPDLWALSFRLPEEEDRARCFGGVTDLADRVPVLDLARPLRMDTLPSTVERVVSCV
jgi:hypothetical protein